MFSCLLSCKKHVGQRYSKYPLPDFIVNLLIIDLLMFELCYMFEKTCQWAQKQESIALSIFSSKV